MYKGWKRIECVAAIILVAFLVYAGIVFFKRAVSQLFAQEEFEYLNGWTQYEWPTDSAYCRASVCD